MAIIGRAVPKFKAFERQCHGANTIAISCKKKTCQRTIADVVQNAIGNTSKQQDVLDTAFQIWCVLKNTHGSGVCSKHRSAKDRTNQNTKPFFV